MEPPVFTAEQFILWYPEFAANNRDQIFRVISLAQGECLASVWGCDRVQAIASLAAHKLLMQFAQAGQIAGMAIEAAKGGTPSLPKPGGGNPSADLGATAYGQEFLRLKRGLSITGMVV